MNVLKRTWRFVKWPLLTLVILYAALLVYRVFDLKAEEKTAATVAEIHAQRLSMKDVDGSNLPPAPDPARVDATVEGVDANQNGIRDDVELEIFERYGDDTKLRAAMLQYAMAMQTYLTKVSNSETWISSAQQLGRGYGCVFDMSVRSENVDDHVSEVKDLQLDSNSRANAYEQNDVHQTSYKALNGADCDVEL